MARGTLLLPLALAGCATMNTARALRPGESAFGVTLGGPIITSPVPTPLPNLVPEGRWGVGLLAKRPVDIRFGGDLTGLAYGTLAVHVGSTWQLVEAYKARPAFAVTNQIFFATNFADWSKQALAHTTWGVWQLEATVSWDVGTHMLYVGLGNYLDVIEPDLLLTPSLGFEIDAKKVRVQIELRWYAVNQKVERDDIDWLTPGMGALGANVGVIVPIGGGS